MSVPSSTDGHVAPVMETKVGSRATPRRRYSVTFDDQVLLWSIGIGLPGTIAAVTLLWLGDYQMTLQAALTVLLLGIWLGAAYALRNRVVRSLRTISNLLSGLHEGDYSIRGRVVTGAGSLDEVFREINALVETLREQRLGAVEATALLRTVMGEIDVAVFAIGSDQRVQLVNRAAERLLQQTTRQLLGRTAVELELSEFLAGDAARTVERAFPGATGRWSIRRTTFREQGRQHHLIVLSDLSRELREEERQAWQRLVRVLGHELNNSLAPIKSISGSLRRILQRESQPDDWREDMERGLDVIGSRAGSLNRFIHAYSQLARLPKPRLQAVELAGLVRRVAGLETRMPVTVAPGPDVTAQMDSDQTEQLLINLVRNGADAALETSLADERVQPVVRVTWLRNGNWLDVQVEDNGPGLSNTGNLFVPFFTTKPKGSGIGLVLCRQIAEAHGGSLTLENRPDAKGCIARLRMPAA